MEYLLHWGRGKTGSKIVIQYLILLNDKYYSKFGKISSNLSEVENNNL